MGVVSMTSVEYEQITINEPQHTGNDTISVRFKNASCASL
jgi:hypothetical protein